MQEENIIRQVINSLGLGPRLGPLAATARPGLRFGSLLSAAAAGPVCGKLGTFTHNATF